MSKYFCVDCSAEIIRSANTGRPPKRCVRCKAEWRRRYDSNYYAKSRKPERVDLPKYKGPTWIGERCTPSQEKEGRPRK